VIDRPVLEGALRLQLAPAGLPECLLRWKAEPCMSPGTGASGAHGPGVLLEEGASYARRSLGAEGASLVLEGSLGAWKSLVPLGAWC
jgi:hypothetical protein